MLCCVPPDNDDGLLPLLVSLDTLHIHLIAESATMVIITGLVVSVETTHP